MSSTEFSPSSTSDFDKEQRTKEQLVDVNAQHSTIYYNGKSVRIIKRQNQLWFVAADICRALDIYKLPNGTVSSTKATYSLKYNQEKCTFVGAIRNARHKLTFVNEQGLYKLINNSGAHTSHTVKEWLEQLVYPTLNPTNSLPSPNQANQANPTSSSTQIITQLTDDEVILKAITILQARLSQTTPTSKPQSQWLTVAGWCDLNKLNINRGERLELGMKAKALCRQAGIDCLKSTTTNVNAYPQNIIAKAAKSLGLTTNKPYLIAAQ